MSELREVLVRVRSTAKKAILAVPDMGKPGNWQTIAMTVNSFLSNEEDERFRIKRLDIPLEGDVTYYEDGGIRYKIVKGGSRLHYEITIELRTAPEGVPANLQWGEPVWIKRLVDGGIMRLSGIREREYLTGHATVAFEDLYDEQSVV